MCGLGVLVDAGGPKPPPQRFTFPAPLLNPALHVSNVRFALPQAAVVHAKVFDVTGRQIVALVDGRVLPPGEHVVSWDGRDAGGQRVAAGIYEVCIVAGTHVGVRRIVLIK